MLVEAAILYVGAPIYDLTTQVHFSVASIALAEIVLVLAAAAAVRAVKVGITAA